MKYNSIGEQLIAKAKELDPSYKPDKFNDMSEAIDVILNNSGSGGESVSPTLFLIDPEKGTVRTTITEQEKLNLEKGLYNQVYYLRSDQDLDLISMYMPSRLFSLFEGNYLFSIMVAVDENNPVVNNLEVYMLKIGEKDASGEHPITIEEQYSINLGSGSSEIPTITFED